ncbi:hypothetical protein B0O44_103524 [Pedobacter nutrimenti]|uniref:Uncharacterized protein n=2 Tax=Pedobacter nutrimenti TaxID=1241337 RepID=A0A318UID9_9SPHI|nr:hypothetical protein B0O44_103524 [Pedobacter nutrimenti]
MLLVLCFFISLRANAQSEKIVYILSDSVEIELKKQIDKSRQNNPDISFSCMLWTKSDGLYCVSLFKNEENSGNDFVKVLVRNTNRYLLIEKDKLPLIFDYDFKFSSSDLKHIGDFGEREGNIKRSEFLFHGYTIFFDSQGKVIKTSNY